MGVAAGAVNARNRVAAILILAMDVASWERRRLAGILFSRASRACRRDAGAPRGGRDRSAASLWANMRIADRVDVAPRGTEYGERR